MASSLSSGLARLFVLAALTTSCVLTMSFDHYDTSTPVYGVSGVLDGLDPGVTVTLLLNGDGTMALLASNGPFAFPPSLVDGAAYAVTVAGVPPSESCGSASGTIAGADASGIAIHCLSNDATLASLSTSAGPLWQTFSPTTLAYTAGPVRVAPLLAPTSTTTVTATASHAGASITIDGAPVASGVMSAPQPLHDGANPLAIDVSSPSGKHASYTLTVAGAPNDYVKASNARTVSYFGWSVAFSADGSTLAIGSTGEPSDATGVNGDQSNASTDGAGAVYVFVRSGATWSQQAYIKASNTAAGAQFGAAVALSSSGDTLAVGADYEASVQPASGAAYVFARSGASWSQQAYVKASNPTSFALFGSALTLSADGSTLAVAATGESSNATGIDGNQSDTSMNGAGAAYVFVRVGTTWSQQAYVKASNTRTLADFGASVALSGDGATLAVGSDGESSAATGINGNQADTSASTAGAAYVFIRSGSSWSQQAYVKASNTASAAGFGTSAALSNDGSTLAVGAIFDKTGGAAYVFSRTTATWTQQVYLKASNAATGAGFGGALALAADGSTLIVGAASESSGATGLNGDGSNNAAGNSGAAYLFTRSGASWSQRVYVKASNTRADAAFGSAVAISGDGSMVVASAPNESSASSGVNGNQSDTSAPNAGAAYVF